MGMSSSTECLGFIQGQNPKIQQYGIRLLHPLSTNAAETRLAGVGGMGSHGMGNLECEE